MDTTEGEQPEEAGFPGLADVQLGIFGLRSLAGILEGGKKRSSCNESTENHQNNHGPNSPSKETFLSIDAFRQDSVCNFLM